MPKAVSYMAKNTLKMDEALLTVHNQLTEDITVLFVSDYCYKCLYQPVVNVSAEQKNASVVVSTLFTLTLKVEPYSQNRTLCRWTQAFEEAGHYSLRVTQYETTSDVTCFLSVDKSPNNSYLPLLAAALVLAVLSLLWTVAPYVYRWKCTSKIINLISCRRPQLSTENEDLSAEITSQPKSSRLKSLDTFRGLSLTLMVFVNYGGGGYWFFQHAPWNGLTVADLVMPWFVFIIGTSVVLAFSSMRRRGVGRLQLLRKLSWRSAVLILIGFCFINYSPRDGQRTVMVLVTDSWSSAAFGLHLLCSGFDHNWWNPIQDLVLYWPEWLFIVALETVWLCVTFLLPVPGCPTGYLGAGGIGDEGLFPNCTGGAAAYVDRWLLGDNIYWHPTCKTLYRTTQPFDPEGVLGTINSVVMGFMGMQAGKILLFFRPKNRNILIRFLVWAILLGTCAAILSKCTRDQGFIPVNKNLWSLSYVTCMGFTSFLLFGLMYFIIDVRGWWGGQPFIYPGMNSIFVYVGHSLLGFYFPFSWEMRYQDGHWEGLFRSLWGTFLWVLIAYFLYRKKFFLKI
ncbi:heparan-alpha-glucosaminide N-acetyltransferase [Sardina pilchardus]|uniref:heparan-alpha-glucosaminide N-acetyltransferase n=1 Tax=Sardina pilchardus TaxID=27697 RepID=UPI002E0FE4C4